MKPGVRTTEFWLVAAFNTAVLAASLAEALPARAAVYATAVANVGYAVARGIAKFK